MRSFTWLATGSALMVSMTACSPMSSNMQTAAVNNRSAVNGVTKSANDLSCLDSKVDYILNTDITDFEMQGGGSLKAGFSPTGIPLANIGLGITYTQGLLQTEMHIFDPLKPGVELASVTGSATSKDISFSLNFSAALASVGPSFWYTTPVSVLSQNALTNNIANLSQHLDSLVQTAWWTTVTQINGEQGFFIPAGSMAGIQVGDEFKVMDATYEWAGDGTPCQNELIMPLINSTNPTNVAKAQTVGVDYTYLVVTSARKPVQLHDYVTISKLVQLAQPVCNTPFGIGCPATPAARTTLSRSIRIGTITSKPIPFVDQSGMVQNLDITPYLLNQLQALLPNQSIGDFYVHQ